MASKLKITGFARFLIAMLFIVPIAYLVASYANGEDAIGNIKQQIGLEQTTTSEQGTIPAVDACDELQRLVNRQEQRIEQLERENERLRAQ